MGICTLCVSQGRNEPFSLYLILGRRLQVSTTSGVQPPPKTGGWDFALEDFWGGLPPVSSASPPERGRSHSRVESLPTHILRRPKGTAMRLTSDAWQPGVGRAMRLRLGSFRAELLSLKGGKRRFFCAPPDVDGSKHPGSVWGGE